MGQYFCRIDGTALHEFHQPRNLFAMVAVPHPDRNVFVHRGANGKGSRRIRINTHDGERARFRQRLDRPRQHDRRGIAWSPVAAGRLAVRRYFPPLVSARSATVTDEVWGVDWGGNQ